MKRKLLSLAVAGLVALAGNALTAETAEANPFANLTVKNGKPVLNVCTASKGGGYWGMGAQIQASLRGVAVVNVIPTKGTEANLKGAHAIVSGNPSHAVAYNGKQYACHILIYQEDGPSAYPNYAASVERVAFAIPEPVLLITKEDGGFDNLDDFEGEGKLCVQRGAGALVTMKAFGELDSDYKTLKTVQARSWSKCLRSVKDGEAQGIFYVGSPISDAMKDIDKKAKSYGLRLRKVSDSNLNDSGVYKDVEVNASTFSNLTGWGDVTTVYTRAAIGIATPVMDVLENNGMLDAVESAIGEAADTAVENYMSQSPLEF